MKKNVNRKILCIVGICIILITVGGYLYYQHVQQQRILDSMNITFNENVEIEYGVKEYDIDKELIKEVKNAKIKDIPKIDTMKIGEQTLQFILVNDGLEKEIDYKIQIKDTKAPEITFKEDKIELTVDDEFDIKSNIESVKDPVDGDIKEDDKVLELNKKATEEYNKLKKEDIKNDTKVAETSLNEFFIEDIQDKDEKNLYLKNCYYINSDIDTSKQGEYTVVVIAVDKNGLKTTKDYKVIVKKKEIENSNTVHNNNTSHNITSNHTNSQTTQNSKKGISAVINSALSQVGTPYVYGGSTPSGFDCSGLIYWAYNSNGYNIPRSVRSAGYSIGKNLANAQAGDIIVTPGHVSLVISKYSIPSADNIKRYSIKLVQAVEGDGVVADTTFGHIVQENGTLEYNSLNIQDIRRMK